MEMINLEDLKPDHFDYDHAGDVQPVYVSHAGKVYRVLWEQDQYPEAPDFDSLTPMVYLAHGYIQRYEHADTIMEAWRYFRLNRSFGRFNSLTDPYGLFTRYLKIYFGSSVVTFDSELGTRGGPAAVFFDTAEWREATGWHNGLEGNPAEETREIWQAYASGDVWIFTVDRRVTGETYWEDGQQTTATRWDDVDLCGGFYGHGEIKHAVEDMIIPAIKADADA